MTDGEKFMDPWGKLVCYSAENIPENVHLWTSPQRLWMFPWLAGWTRRSVESSGRASVKCFDFLLMACGSVRTKDVRMKGVLSSRRSSPLCNCLSCRVMHVFFCKPRHYALKSSCIRHVTLGTLLLSEQFMMCHSFDALAQSDQFNGK